jgi:hypothetical protein
MQGARQHGPTRANTKGTVERQRIQREKAPPLRRGFLHGKDGRALKREAAHQEGPVC